MKTILLLLLTTISACGGGGGGSASASSSTTTSYAGLIGQPIQFDSASVDASWAVTDAGVTYALNNVANNGVEAPTLVAPGSGGSGKAMLYQANSYTGAATTQRVEHYTATAQSLSGGMRYYGWDFKLDAGDSYPANWVILHQFRQEGDSGSPIGALELVPGVGSWKLQFLVRNTDYYFIDSTNGPSGNSLTIWTDTVTAGSWHRFVIGFHPDASASGTGQAQLWLDGVQVKDWTGKLGFPASFLGKTIYGTYSAHVGIYRAAQNQVLHYSIDNYRRTTVASGAI